MGHSERLFEFSVPFYLFNEKNAPTSNTKRLISRLRLTDLWSFSRVSPMLHGPCDIGDCVEYVSTTTLVASITTYLSPVVLRGQAAFEYIYNFLFGKF